MKKDLEGIYTITMDEAHAERFERADKLISIDSPVISILFAAGVVALLSFNGLVA